MEKTSWKILLIDDDQEDYMLTRLMLSEAHGAECTLDWASSFEAGREALQKSLYSAVLMDYDLGSGKGPELIREAVAQGFTSPIILMTGYSSYEVDVEAMEAGAALYLSKEDVTPLVLERTIRYAIQYKRVLQELQEARDGLEVKVQQRTAELARINRELRALNTIGKAVSSSLELSNTFDLIRQLLTSELSILSGAVFSYDQALAEFHMETTWGSFGELSGEAILSFSNTVLAVREGQPVLASIPASIFPSGRDEGGPPDRSSDFLCLPLFSQGTVQGLLALSLEGSRIHGDGQTDFLSSLGSQIGVAIQNAKLFKAEEQAHRMAETLRIASLALSNSLDLDVVIDSLFDSVQNLIPEADRIILLSSEDGILQVKANAGKGSVSSGSTSEMIFDETEHPLLASPATRLVQDTRDWPEWKPVLGGLDVRSWLGIPIVAAGDRIGVCCLESGTPGCFSVQHIHLAEALVGQAATTIQNARLYQQVRDSREHLQILSRKLVEVQEMERRYIARELHDETSQALIGLVYALEILKKDAGDPRAVEAGVNELNLIIGDILKSLHRLAVDLRPAALDHLGLVPALRQYLDGVREKHGLSIHLAALDLPMRLPLEVETTLYRIVQEAMANVVRHAGATRADVSVWLGEHTVGASIVDNGRGFNLDEALAKERLGLFGMRERVEMLDGSLVIDSSPGHGTRISLEIPYAV